MVHARKTGEMTYNIDQGEPEIYVVEYHNNIHLFDDPGARRLWMDNVIIHGAAPADFKLWDY
jgi:hypothetical protein